MVHDQPPAGHRSMPGAGRVRIDAWAPSRERCIAEAVTAMIGSFADTTDATPGGVLGFLVEPGTDEEILADVLDEVLSLIASTGRLPTRVDVTRVEDGSLDVQLRMTDLDQVELIGLMPIAIPGDEAHIGRAGVGWSCTVTVETLAAL